VTSSRRPQTSGQARVGANLEFSSWCEAQKLREIVDIEPLHVAAYIEQLSQRLAKPSVKQHLATIRMLFDWLVVGRSWPPIPLHRYGAQVHGQ